MADLLLDDDASVFEAALSFVDECSFDSHDPDLKKLTASATSILAPCKNEQSHPVSFKEPSFTLDCRETAAMVPLNKKMNLNFNVRFVLPRNNEIMTQPKAAKTKKVLANPNRARDEAKYELAFLRRKVAELDLQMKIMQRNATSRGDMLTPRHLEQAPRVWEEIAARQKKRRDEAQWKNARLRLLVERKRKMAKGLCALLRKQLLQQSAGCLRGTASISSNQRVAPVLDYKGNIRDFQHLFHLLQLAHKQIDVVFASKGLSPMGLPTCDVHVRKEIDGKYIEVFADKLLPFSLHDCGEAAWDHFKGIEKHFGNGGLYEKAAKNLDQPYTIIEDFTKEMFSNNSRADIKAKQIVQRIISPDQDMIFFVSSVTPVEIKHKPIDGLVYHAREYALTTRFANSTPEHELSLLQLYVRISFDYDPIIVFDSRHVRLVTQFVIGNVAGSLRCYQERIENALVDQALKRQ